MKTIGLAIGFFGLCIFASSNYLGFQDAGGSIGIMVFAFALLASAFTADP